MFGLSFEKIIIIAVIAVLILGPERLPKYAAQLARFTKTVRDMASGARDRMREEMGPEFEDIDWTKLDPRQYDPRRIIRDALLDDAPPQLIHAPSETVTATTSLVDGADPPFDTEST